MYGKNRHIIKRAWEFLTSGDIDTAITLVREYLEKDLFGDRFDYDFETKFSLAALYHAKGDCTGAAVYYIRALNADNQNISAISDFAILLIECGLVDCAEKLTEFCKKRFEDNQQIQNLESTVLAAKTHGNAPKYRLTDTDTKAIQNTVNEYALGKQDLILVYQPGKVGSKSIVKGLIKIGYKRAYHLHFLNTDTVFKLASRYITPDSKIDSNIIDSIIVRRYLHQNSHNRVKIIVPVREPVSRNLSHFFASYVDFPGLYELYTQGTISAQQILEWFVNEFDHAKAFNWFEEELQQHTGFDIYQHPFDKEKGYGIYRHKNFDLLFIKLEQSQSCYGPAFREFLGIEEFPLIRRNITANPLYKQIKGHIHLPAEYLEKMYGLKYARHFYTEKEIQGFTEKYQIAETVVK